jgi:hypothetical protein
MKRHLGAIEKMLQEEGLNCRQNTTWTSLVLMNSVLDLFIEVKSLLPRVVKMSFAIFEQEFGDARTLISSDLIF